MPPSTPQYRTLRADKIVDTIERLQHRIDERFPASSLGRVAAELHQISLEAVARAEKIRRPDWRLRVAIGVLLVTILGLLLALVQRLELTDDVLLFDHFVQLLDSSLASVVVIGAAIVFLATLEVRLKRSRALRALHELRALAHIVDMHQLTKDPERITGRGTATSSSPPRTMTPFELGRYLDYCTELLSLVSKVGELYVQDFPDTVALEAVDQLATLTSGLSRTIWQKIMILESMIGPETAHVPAQATTPAP